MASATVDTENKTGANGAKRGTPDRTGAKRPATLDDLKRRKKARRDHVDIPMEDGVVRVEIKAIGTSAYDELVSNHPPTPKQRAQNPNAVFNQDTFACALIAACVVEPHLDYEDVKEIMESEEWAGGEFQDLFMACVKINNSGFDVPFSGAG